MTTSNKIAIFIYSMAGGGAERVMSYLLPYLIEKKHDAVLILMNDAMDYVVPTGISVHFLEKSNGKEPGLLKLIKLPWLSFKYSRILKNEGITHSFSLLTRPNYVNIIARFMTNHKYKLMISERNFPSAQYNKGNLQSKINNFLVRSLYKRADLIVSNAKASARDLIENFNVNEENTTTIYNPIDIEKIESVKPISNFYDPLFFNIISIGRLTEVKNHSFLLNAIAPFEKIRLYILGEGEEEDRLKKLISNLGLEDRVFLLGFKKNPFEYLKNADLFLFGSKHEGFPNVLLESMCCGLPIITTNCKSGPDEMLGLIDEKKDNIMFTDYGILVPVNNLHLMKKALEYALDNPDYLKSCSINARKHIKSFKKEPILEQYRQVILA